VSRARPLVAGVSALGKSLLVLVGVPTALWRLWLLAAVPGRAPGAVGVPHLLALWTRVVLVVVASAWAFAAQRLGRDLVAALRRREVAAATTWSARWAAAVAGLLVLATAGSSLARHGAPGAWRRPAAVAAQRLEQPRLATVAANQSLAGLAATVLGDARAWPLLAASNLGARQADGAWVVDPNLLRPGWRLALPAGRARAAPVGSPSEAADAPRAHEGHLLAELSLLGLGIVTTAALARRLRLLERVGESLRSPGERRRRAEPAAGEAASLIAPLAQSLLLEWIDAANRLLWGALRARGPGAALPEVRLVRAGPDGVELLLASDVGPPPEPFVARSGGRWWALEPSLGPRESTELSRGLGRYVPWLVPLGDDGEAAYLLALGPGRRLGVVGAPDEVAAALRALSVALRTLPWAEELSVELLGASPPPADELCHQLAESSAPALATLGAAARRSLAERLTRSWRREPLVLVADERTAPAEELLAAAARVAGVIAPGALGTEHLVVEQGTAVLEPYGLRLRHPAANERQAALADSLLAAARTRPAPVSPPLARPVPAPGGDAAIAIEVLGPRPRLAGPVGPIADRYVERALEALACLALRGGRAPADELARVLFSGQPHAEARRRLDAVTGAAALALGLDRDGARGLEEVDGELRLSPAVGCDWWRFVGLAWAARAAESGPALDHLRQALALVEGPPLARARDGFPWFVAEGHAARMGEEIVDAAHHLATLATAAGELPLARWAVARGRLIEPASEMLARDLMAICDLEGDRAGVEAAFEGLQRALEALDGSEPSAETRALYHALAPKRICR